MTGYELADFVGLQEAGGGMWPEDYDRKAAKVAGEISQETLDQLAIEFNQWKFQNQWTGRLGSEDTTAQEAAVKFLEESGYTQDAQIMSDKWEVAAEIAARSKTAQNDTEDDPQCSGWY